MPDSTRPLRSWLKHSQITTRRSGRVSFGQPPFQTTADMAGVIPNRKGYELWETMAAAIMQTLAFFFAAQFDINPAFLQYLVRKVEEGSKAEQKAIKAFDQNYASRLTHEVVERLVVVWDMWTSVMQ